MNEEVRKIFLEAIEKSEKIVEEAKANGTWQMGLDSNNELFEELHKETRRKLNEVE